MITYKITGNTGESTILLGEDIANLDRYIEGRNYAIVTDEAVYGLYGEAFDTDRVIKIGQGETNKTLHTLEQLYETFLELELDRSSLVIGVGGGIVCDVAGFAASTFMRGLAFGAVPTTLLAQVDASVGGKTGVNFHGYKNLIGTFTQPEFVLIDPHFLKTLEPRMLGCGFAEVIKHGAIADPALFEFLETRNADILALVPECIERIVHDSIEIKSTIVNADEKEKGERRKLNFGHTFGHAFEKRHHLPHGEAVAVGMVVAAKLSQHRGLLQEADVERLVRVIDQFGLPTQISTESAPIMEALRKDKKRDGDNIKFVLLSKLGQAVIQDVNFQELERVVMGL